ncbi:MAG TPA: 5'-3' exonuclease H3TH domain-containing protein [Nocardioidaceae bacterium]|nr:5'-3' exonuclease H3TH domain-containing protein [Nocardioidaceae bacterium]
MTRTLLAVDGNSLLHRSFHAAARSGFRTADGRAMWAVRGMLSQLSAAVDRVCADAVVVGFDDPHVSRRRERWPSYKAQRPPKPRTLEDQLDAAVEVLCDLGVVVARPSGLEADDVLASAAAYARSVGARTVVATSDRDSYALIDDNTRMLRILNGGVDASPLLDPRRLEMVTGVRPEQYLDFAALRGDASDNLPGVPGVGPKTAARLLAEFGSAHSAFEDAVAGGARCRSVLGSAAARTLAEPSARAVWEHNCAVMAMVDDAPLGLDLEHGVGCLPLTEEAVWACFTALDLHGPTAVRALTGREPSTPRPADVDAAWRPPARRTVWRHPPLPRRPEPVSVQETLF